MFVHKSMPLALSFAVATMIGLAAGPAQADQQRDYCSAPEVCNQRQIGIIQKERDGVNYFYGGSDVPAPLVTYIYLRDDDASQPVAAPIRTSDLYATSFAAPLPQHRFRMKKDHWKWKKPHPGPLDLPGPPLGGMYMAP